MKESIINPGIVRLFRVFWVGVLLVALSWGYSAAEPAKVKANAGNHVEVLAGAYTGAKRIGLLRAGDDVEVLIRSGLWAKIKTPKLSGWMSNAQLELPKLQYVVTASPAANGFEKGKFPQKPKAELPFGTLVRLNERFGAATEIQASGKNIVVRTTDIQQCVPNVRDVQSIQFCLLRQGQKIGPADNKMGPKTERAIAAVLERKSLSQSNLSFACLKQIICSPALNPEISNPSISTTQETAYQSALERALTPRAVRRRMAAASAAFNAGKCEALANFSVFERNGQSVAECEKIRLHKTQIARAETLFEERDCAELATIPASAQGEFTQDACARLKQTEERKALFARAISQLDCDGAAQLAQSLGGLESSVMACRKKLQRANDEADFAEAIAQNDCGQIQSLQDRVGKAGAASRCRFNLAMSASTARKMYLAAQKYDRQDDGARAKLLYEEVIERFADDDLALNASERLIVMNDRERSERERKALEVEMARLRQQSAQAQRQLAQARAAQAAAAAVSAPQYPGGFRPGDAAVICMQNNNHIPVTVVRNPSGSRMEIRPQRDFYTGNIFIPTEYYRGRNYFFERGAIAHSRSGCR